MKEVLGSAQLARVIADHPMSAVDVGARGGIANDLLPIAGVVNVVGLEPDVEDKAVYHHSNKVHNRLPNTPG